MARVCHDASARVRSVGGQRYTTVMVGRVAIHVHILTASYGGPRKLDCPCPFRLAEKYVRRPAQSQFYYSLIVGMPHLSNPRLRSSAMHPIDPTIPVSAGEHRQSDVALGSGSNTTHVSTVNSHAPARTGCRCQQQSHPCPMQHVAACSLGSIYLPADTADSPSRHRCSSQPRPAVAQRDVPLDVLPSMQGATWLLG